MKQQGGVHKVTEGLFNGSLTDLVMVECTLLGFLSRAKEGNT